MKHKLVFSNLLLPSLFLALAPTALATSNWYVDGVHGSDNNNCKSRQMACKTIGHAISLAHSGDSVRVAPAVYKENLTIGIDLKVIGSGAKATIIDGGKKGRVVSISTGAVTLSKLGIRNGFIHGFRGGGIENEGTLKIIDCVVSGNVVTDGGTGGGISNGGELTINNSTIHANSVSKGKCTEFCLVWGGGITNGGTLTINNSTIRGNSAFDGGGIWNQTYVEGIVVHNSTISGNSAVVLGGGIWNRLGTIAVNNSTISENRAGLGGGIVDGDDSFASQVTISNTTISGNAANEGSGIYNYSGSTATFQDSVVANISSDNCFNSGTISSHGYNLSSDGSCNFNNTGDLNNTDPKLGKLENYGGPTQTVPLLSGSPAIDAGNPSGCTDGHGHLLKTDQRGKPRPDKEDTSGCDMGAYERQQD